MASIGTDPGGLRRILFVAPDGERKTIRLGKMSATRRPRRDQDEGGNPRGGVRSRAAMLRR